MSVSYAIRHALEVLGDSGYDEDIRRAALAELDDLEAEQTRLWEALFHISEWPNRIDDVYSADDAALELAEYARAALPGTAGSE